MTCTRRMDLVAYILREFVKTCALTHPVKTDVLPFVKDPESFDPIRMGIVTIRTTVETPKDNVLLERHVGFIERKVFTFSRSQMLLACCLYGTSTLPIDVLDSFAALATTMFAFYVNAFVSAEKDTWRLADFLKLLDPTWNVESANQLLKVRPHGKSVGFHDFFSFKSMNTPSESRLKNTLCAEENTPQISPIWMMINDLKNAKQKEYLISAMTPYDHSIVICGKVIFLIYNKHKDGDHLRFQKMREILLSMGLVPEDGMKSDEKKRHAANIFFTGILCAELNIYSVVPVLCVAEKLHDTPVYDIRVRVPNARDIREAKLALTCEGEGEDSGADMRKRPHIAISCASPMTFQPRLVLSATFNRTVSEEGSSLWTYCKEEK
ncbi:hypothetical protein STCU_11072 [Strigomonas culicis]|uniref:Uncharacterized protein n=1 Tax=Strigomonas culicis TaxID=28005 RepID=S9V1K4_9TRYP|nr:hypothetical protein STCU_11072 [Strigomonas culicis]|eukprot:EPY16665.1 hypothetical protein STCU_11072 [Strigomonas culicis]